MGIFTIDGNEVSALGDIVVDASLLVELFANLVEVGDQ